MKLNSQIIIKIIAFVNVLWLLLVLSIEVILVYEFGDPNGLQDLIPSLIGTDVSKSNATTQVCTYHMYRKYSCKRAMIKSQEQFKSSDFNVSFHLFLPLLWFVVCALDIAFSIILYQAVVQNSLKMMKLWLVVSSGTLLFQLVILIMYSAARFNFWSEIPLITFCLFRLYSLYYVFKFTKIEEESMTSTGSSGTNRKISFRKDKMEDRNNKDDDSSKGNQFANDSEERHINFAFALSDCGNPTSSSSRSAPDFDSSSSTLPNLRKLSHCHSKHAQPLPMLVFN